MSRTDTRSQLLEAGRELMLAHGYTATSVDDVCTRAGVSKGSFYHFFGTKEEFGLALLDAFYHDGMARIRSGGFLRVSDPVERLRAFFDHMERKAPSFWARGCLMGTFATELAESSPVIQARVAELFDGLVSGLAPLFQAVVGDRGEAVALAEETLTVLEGSIILARAHGDPERIATGLRRFRRVVEGRIATGEAASAL